MRSRSIAKAAAPIPWVPTDGARETVRDALARFTIPSRRHRDGKPASITSQQAFDLLNILRGPSGHTLVPWTQLPPV